MTETNIMGRSFKVKTINNKSKMASECYTKMISKRSILDSLYEIKNMDSVVHLSLQGKTKETFTKETSNMGNQMAMASISGLMVICIKDNLRTK